MSMIEIYRAEETAEGGNDNYKAGLGINCFESDRSQAALTFLDHPLEVRPAIRGACEYTISVLGDYLEPIPGTEITAVSKRTFNALIALPGG